MNLIKKFFFNTILVLMNFFVFLFFLEFSSFFLYEKIIDQKGKNIVSGLIAESQHQKTGDFEDGTAISEIEILPYYLYRNSPFSKINKIQQVNSEGYRNGNKEFGEKKSDSIRIITIGGSTTFGWLIKEYEQTWPSQLEKILQEQFNKPIEVINAGLPAGMSSESLVSFILKDKYLKPDIVIFHNGGNDIAPLLYANYYPDYRYHRSITGSDKLRPGELFWIMKSHFVKLVYAFWMKNSNPSLLRTDPEKQLTPKEALENLQRNEPIGFQRNMETLIEEAHNLGNAEVILFPFYLAKKDVYKIIPPQMRYSEKIHLALEKGLEKNKAVLKSLAEKHNLSYYEMKPDAIPLEYFFDHCHLKPEGEKVKASFIAQKISPVVKKLLSVKQALSDKSTKPPLAMTKQATGN